MLNLKDINETNLAEVFQLSVSPEQLPFVGTISDILDAKSAGSDFHVVAMNSEVIGLFIADTTYYQEYDFASENEIGLRGFFIDQRHQGNGYGKAAAELLREYLKSKYPYYDGIVLTVNCKNSVAYSCYISAGFRDTNELYLGGKAGPQNILRINL